MQRDRHWVEWRFLSAPAAEPRWRYQLLLAQRGDEPVGYLAYRVQAEAGHATAFIADLWSAPADEPGLRPALGAFMVKARPLAQALDLAALRQPANWYLTGSDFDVI